MTTLGAAQTPGGLTADIAPQPLEEALAAFASQTGLQLVYLSEIDADQKSKGAPAGLAPSAALTRLLAGTGLQFEFLNTRSVRIFAASERPRPSVRVPPPRPENGDALTGTLDEVLVTANKREEVASKVPISMSVWTQEAMEVSGIKDLTGLAALAPGVYYSYFTNVGPGYIYFVVMRGIFDLGPEATTGIYLDDTPMHSRSAVTGLGDILPITFDLERVEVLRGPQGTLGGDANSGGAIHFITNPPSLTVWSGLARSEVATTSHGGMSYEAGVAEGGPIVPDEIGFRVSLWTRRDGGYVDRVDPFTGATVDANANRSGSNSVRAALTIATASGVRIMPALMYQSKSLHDSSVFYTYLSDPGAGVLRNGKLLQQPFDDQYYLASVKVTAELPGTQLAAITSYSHRAASVIYDWTNGIGANSGGWGNPLGNAYPVSYLDAVPLDESMVERSLSQEFRLASSDPKTPLSWIAGISFARSTEEHGLAAVPVNPSLAGAADYFEHIAASTTQIDGFGQVDLRSIHGVTGSLGVRVGRWHNRLQDAAGSTSDLPPPYDYHTQGTAVTPRFSLSYAPDGYGLTYLTIAKGYQLGGANLPPSTPCGTEFPPTYAPDTTWSYELGTKQRLLGGRVQLDGSLFHLVWRDMQQAIFPSACGQMFWTNAGSAASNGIDLAVRATVTDRVRMALELEYADARYTETVRLEDGNMVYKGDVVGLLPNVPPPWSGNVWAEFDVFRSPTLTVSVRAEDAVRSHNTGPFVPGGTANFGYFPGLSADPATNLCNVRLRFVWADYEVAGFMNNVFDAQPELNRTPDAPLSTLNYAATFRPRTIGLTGSVRF